MIISFLAFFSLGGPGLAPPPVAPVAVESAHIAAPIPAAVRRPAVTQTTVTTVPVTDGPQPLGPSQTVDVPDWVTYWTDPQFGPGSYEGSEDQADAEALVHDGSTPVEVTDSMVAG